MFGRVNLNQGRTVGRKTEIFSHRSLMLFWLRKRFVKTLCSGTSLDIFLFSVLATWHSADPLMSENISSASAPLHCNRSHDHITRLLASAFLWIYIFFLAFALNLPQRLALLKGRGSERVKGDYLQSSHTAASLHPAGSIHNLLNLTWFF